MSGRLTSKKEPRLVLQTEDVAPNHSTDVAEDDYVSECDGALVVPENIVGHPA